MTSTHEKVSRLHEGDRPEHTPHSAAAGIDQALKVIDGRWKLVILFNLFGGKVLRFSDLERAIPAISQKMLAQQLRQLEADGVVRRIAYDQVPPKVEYCLMAWGRSDRCSAATLRSAARERRELPVLACPPAERWNPDAEQTETIIAWLTSTVRRRRPKALNELRSRLLALLWQWPSALSA